MLRLGLGLTALVLATPAHAGKTLWTVGASGFDHTTIQDAIDSAVDGDTVLVVDAGDYVECLTVDKDITLVGSRGGDGVQITCRTGGSPTIDVVSGDLRLGGVSLTHSSGRAIVVDKGRLWAQGVAIADTDSSDDGGAIYATNSDVELHEVTIDNSSSSGSGGAIHMALGKLTVRGTEITDATAVDGGGIHLKGTALDARGLVVSGSSADSLGGGIYKDGPGVLSLQDSNITGNTAGSQGGGLYVTGVVAHQVTRTLVESNDAAEGGGVWNDAFLTLRDTTVSANSASESGGGVYNGGRSLTVQGGSVQNNSSDGDGAGMYSVATLYLRDAAFSENTAGGDGGGVYQSADTTYMYGSRFELNEAGTDGGGFYTANGSLYGYGTVFDSNLADNGGGIAYGPSVPSTGSLYGVVLDGNEAATSGGGMYVGKGGRVYMYGVHALKNNAVNGGGLYIAEAPAALWIYESEFESNTATYGGGIAHVAPSLVTSAYYYWYLNRSYVHSNVATKDGGGVYVDKGSYNGRDSWIYENEAASRGGGLYTYQTTYLFSRGTTYCANDANQGGGAYVDEGWGTRQFYVAPFVENTSTREGGAAYTGSYNTTTGFRNQTYFYYLTVVGNRSSGTVYDGIHLNNTVTNPEYQYSYYGVYYGNDNTGLSQQSGSTAYQVPYANVFWNHTTAHIYNNPSYRIGTGELYVLNPSFPSYRSGNCFDDDLTDRSGKNWGASGTTGTYGYGMYADNDRDGYSIAEGDCDDNRAARYPGATEINYNNADEDCSGWDVYDADNDGTAAVGVGGTDCDDTDATRYVGATDAWYDGTDSDCSGGSDYDQDGDGYVSNVYGGSDCDDTNIAVRPGAVELPFDGVDQDCDTFDQDFDGDRFVGYWEESTGTVLSDPEGSGFEVDCDPADGEIFPGQVEIWYDGIDSDCAGDDDFDQDGDGWASDEYEGLDCDDTDPEVSPDTPEIWYDGIDANCIGDDDYDQDGDGDRSDDWGGDDCDDTNPDIYGENAEGDAAPDILDDIDNDCDSTVDNDRDQDGVLDWYEITFGTKVNGNDSEPDKIRDGVEWGDISTHEGLMNPFDSDGDSVIDALDEDSDNDEIPDSDEVGRDTLNPRDSDGDGLPDYRDDDDDDDGIPTIVEAEGGRPDTDGDGIDDYLDTDSDNDGASDRSEGAGDKDQDGVPDYLDAGNDIGGEREPITPSGYGFGLGCSAVPAAPTGFAVLLLPLLLVLRRRR